MAVKLSKKAWRMIYVISAFLTPPVCTVVFLNELTKCENLPQLISLYILEIAVCLLFLPSFKRLYKKPHFIGWLISLCGVIVLTAVSGLWQWSIAGAVLMLSVPVVPLPGLVLEPYVSKLKHHLLWRSLCVGIIILIRFLL